MDEIKKRYACNKLMRALWEIVDAYKIDGSLTKEEYDRFLAIETTHTQKKAPVEAVINMIQREMFQLNKKRLEI